MKLLFLFILVAAVSSCTSTTQRDFIKIPFMSVTDARIYIYRDDDSKLIEEPSVYINNNKYKELPNRTVQQYVLPGGEYIFRMDWEYEQTLYINLTAGNTYYIKPWFKEYREFDDEGNLVPFEKDVHSGFEVMSEDEATRMITTYPLQF